MTNRKAHKAPDVDPWVRPRESALSYHLSWILPTGFVVVIIAAIFLLEWR